MATRQDSKRQAREERLRRERESAAADRRRKRRAYGVGGLVVAAAIGLVLAMALGGGGESGGPAADQTSAGEAAGHIHGLGVDPADGSLLIATHSGLFRAAEESTEAPRVGTSDRDLMGFSVVGPGHFIASGHPGSEPDLPGNIGLTESRDGGRTWSTVSLLGEADFHVLRASGQRIYGYDGPNGRFMTSSNLGRDWTERDVPAMPFDLAIHPDDPDHVVAATESGMHESRDAGRSWRKVSDQAALLAWGDADRLFLLDGAGQVRLSRDGGRSSSVGGRIQGRPVAFTATRDAVLVGLEDGTVLQSGDDGASFAVRAQL